jgi:hypothetical protein
MRAVPDAMIVASTLGADALPLATFDRDQNFYGIAVREPRRSPRVDAPWMGESRSPARNGTVPLARNHRRIDKNRKSIRRDPFGCPPAPPRLTATDGHAGTSGRTQVINDRAWTAQLASLGRDLHVCVLEDLRQAIWAM